MSHAYSTLPFLLVSGQARSGTTVLTRAIAQHPDVHSNGLESNYVRDLSTMIALHTQGQRTRQLAVPPGVFIERFRQAMLDVLFPRESTRSPLPRFVSTFSSLRPDALEQLPNLLPGLFVVNIIRSGVEVVASRMVHRVIGARSFKEHCDAWVTGWEMVKWGREQNAYFEVRHEQLLERSTCAKMFDELFGKLDLPSSTLPLEFVFKRHFNVTRAEDETEEQAQDLAQRKHRWQSWTGEQKDQFESICGEAMSRLGYPIPW